MANANVTNNTTTESNNETNWYLTMTMEERAKYALELAEEIAETDERHYCLATALRDNLAANYDEMKGDCGALRLAELLEELMGSAAQQNQLRDCLKAMQINTGAEVAA